MIPTKPCNGCAKTVTGANKNQSPLPEARKGTYYMTTGLAIDAGNGKTQAHLAYLVADLLFDIDIVDIG